MATNSPPEKVLRAGRDTVRSRGKAPAAASGLPGHSGTSAAGRAPRGLRVETMAAAEAISMTGEQLGLFSVPRNQHFDPEGGRAPNIELGLVRPKTRSQREVGQTPEGGKDGKGNGGDGPPAQRKSSRKRKQPKENLTTECAGGLQLPEALQLPLTPRPPSSLSSQPSSSHHFELSVGKLESLGPTLRSSTVPRSVSTPAPEALSQAVLTVSGPHSRAPKARCEGHDHSTPVGQELGQQALLPVPDDGSVTPECRVLSSRVITSGGHSSTSVVSPEVCSVARPEARNILWNLRPRATPRVPAPHSYTPGSSSDRGSRETQRRSRRIAARLSSDNQRSLTIKMDVNLELGPPEPESESDPEPESDPESESESELEPESEPEPESEMESLESEPESQPESELEEEEDPEPGPSSQPQASLSTFRHAVPRRSLLATRGSPPRRPVRMRASSPSPPGRHYPFPGQYNEGASSSSSSSKEDVSCVSGPPSLLNKTPERGSSSSLGDLSSVSGPSPGALWRALIPDLDNLDSSSSEESEEEIEIALHPPA